MLLVFTYKASIEDLQLVHNCIKHLNCEYKLYNIPNHRPEDIIEKNIKIAVTFGPQAFIAVKNYADSISGSTIQVIELPSALYLYPKASNAKHRSSTWDKLSKLKETIESISDNEDLNKLILNENDLPHLDRYHLLLLNKTLENSSRIYFCTNKDNKTIAIAKDKGLLKDKNFDIFISLEELYTVRSIMDVLSIKQVVLEKNTGDV